MGIDCLDPRDGESACVPSVPGNRFSSPDIAAYHNLLGGNGRFEYICPMKTAWCIAFIVLLCESGMVQTQAQDAEIPVKKLVRRDVRFNQSAPYSDETNITRHFGYKVELPKYEVTNEVFEIRIPEALSTNESSGLLVWISPNDSPSIPGEWDEELQKHRLLFVSAHRSGNSRHPVDRFRLALDAVCNMCRRYKVDRQRIYIGGFSGGARIASMLGVGFADIFTGTLCFCGVNFYTDVPAADGKYYPATFTPDPGVLLQGKRN